MEHRILRLPQVEPLLHVPISPIVELVSNRSEAEVLLRIRALAHEFDHLTASLVQWLEHHQYMTIDGDFQDCPAAAGGGQSSLMSSLAPLAHQARVVNRHGVTVLQDAITDCLHQLQRRMDAVQVFADQNASFSQELRLCGLVDRADQRRRLAETESALARRLSRFLSGCDSFYDEEPLPLAMHSDAGTASARVSVGAVVPASIPASRSPAAAASQAPAAASATAAPHKRDGLFTKGAGRARQTPDESENSRRTSDCGGASARTEGCTGRKRPLSLPAEGTEASTKVRNVGTGKESTCADESDKQRQQQQQQQPLSQHEEEDRNDDGGDLAAPSVLTPPLIAAAAAAVGGGGGSTRTTASAGMIAAPHSACSSCGSTLSTGSSSPAIAVASPTPTPTPKSCTRRWAERGSRGERPGAAAAAGRKSRGRKRARVGADDTAAATTSSLWNEQPRFPGTYSPTPPSTREPSPPPLSTQEGSASAAEGAGGEDDGDVVAPDIAATARAEEEEEEENGAGERDRASSCGSSRAQGGVPAGIVAGADVGAAAAVAATTEARALASTAGREKRGAPGVHGGVAGFVLRVPDVAAAEERSYLPNQQWVYGAARAAWRSTAEAGMQDRGAHGEASSLEEIAGQEYEERVEHKGNKEEDAEEEEEEEMRSTAETVEDNVVPAALAAPAAATEVPLCLGSQDGADEAGGADAETDWGRGSSLTGIPPR